jgi:sulfate adenylyltransferase/3'-phosphoadenosine 5'-phosphosulfate synthase
VKQGFVVWLTGLPASGKSTLANLLKHSLENLGMPAVILDGDRVRGNLWPELRYSREDRDENIRRMANLARMMQAEGVVAIVAVISPYRRLREYARSLTERFVEVFMDCPVETCERRDPKGMYARARRGEIPQFTGVSDPYEPPENPELVLQTADLTPAQCLNLMLERLRQLGDVGRSAGGLVTPNGGLLVHQVLGTEEADRVLAENPPRLEIPGEELMDAEKIAVGAYSPLRGFMNRREIEEVLGTYRLPDGTPFGMPVALCVTEERARVVRAGENALLCQGMHAPVAVLRVSSVEKVEPAGWAKAMYGTEDGGHPGAARLAQLPKFLVSGEVSLIAEVNHPYRALRDETGRNARGIHAKRVAQGGGISDAKSTAPGTRVHPEARTGNDRWAADTADSRNEERGRLYDGSHSGGVRAAD